MTCPMEKYSSMTRKMTDQISRFLSTGDCRSVSASSSAAILPLRPLFTSPEEVFPSISRAPYPASVTAFMISEADAFPSTPMELVRRLTEHEDTPGTFDTAFSTLV